MKFIICKSLLKDLLSTQGEYYSTSNVEYNINPNSKENINDYDGKLKEHCGENHLNVTAEELDSTLKVLGLLLQQTSRLQDKLNIISLIESVRAEKAKLVEEKYLNRIELISTEIKSNTENIELYSKLSDEYKLLFDDNKNKNISIDLKNKINDLVFDTICYLATSIGIHRVLNIFCEIGKIDYRIYNIILLVIQHRFSLIHNNYDNLLQSFKEEVLGTYIALITISTEDRVTENLDCESLKSNYIKTMGIVSSLIKKHNLHCFKSRFSLEELIGIKFTYTNKKEAITIDDVDNAVSIYKFLLEDINNNDKKASLGPLTEAFTAVNTWLTNIAGRVFINK